MSQCRPPRSGLLRTHTRTDHEERGKDVVSTEYARMNSMLKAGGRLAFGTDWPASGWVATYRPLDAIQVAMTRAILPQYGKQQVMPIVPPENERITLDQALKAYTLDAAYVLGLENKIGSLQPGKAANLVVLGKGSAQDRAQRNQHHQSEADHDEWKDHLSGSIDGHIRGLSQHGAFPSVSGR